jgi:hypothetical protein
MEVIVHEEPAKPLSAAEGKRLEQLQEVIVVNFQAFVKVGQALAEIRDRQLYRIEHRTFEAYCKEIFDISRRTGYQYIAAAEVVENVRNCAQNEDQLIDLLPMNEAQARPLTKLQPEQQKAVWQAVVAHSGDNRKVTASLVNKTVKEYLGENVKATVRSAQARIGSEQHVSAEFKEAFSGFMDQLLKEKGANYKTTSRAMIVKHLDALRQVIAEDGGTIEDHPLPLPGNDTLKVERAGFKLFRADRTSKTIKTRSATGSWIKHSGPYPTYKEMEAEFAIILQDEKQLRG